MFRRLRRLVLRLFLLFVVPAAAVIVALHYFVVGQRYVTTENAYVKANNVGISAEIDGRVARVAVVDNMRVKAGDLLFQIDSEPFRIAFEKTQAELSMVRLRIDALKAEYRQATVELREAQQNIGFYQREYNRQNTLSRKGIASVSKRDAAEQNLSNARQRVNGLREKRRRILARLGGSIKLPIERHPEFQEAKADRDAAERNLRHTMIYAPTDGMVGRVKLQAGEYVKAGEPVLPLVESQRVWIEANLKETQLTYVTVGLKAEVVIDAYPDHSLAATVNSISPSTGAELSILPPQNASGNWVKVVQRVPVRLELELKGAMPPMRSGMTAMVSIDTRREYSLVDFVGSALAWKSDK